MDHATFNCQFCDNTYQNQSGYSNHISSEHQEEIKQLWDQATTQYNESEHMGKLLSFGEREILYWYCSFSRKYFKDLKNHLTFCKLSNKNITCLWCTEPNMTTFTMRGFTNHINTEHKSEMFELWDSIQAVASCVNGHIKKHIDISGKTLGYFYCPKANYFFTTMRGHDLTCMNVRILKIEEEPHSYITNESIAITAISPMQRVLSILPTLSLSSSKECHCSFCVAGFKFH